MEDHDIYIKKKDGTVCHIFLVLMWKRQRLGKLLSQVHIGDI